MTLPGHSWEARSKVKKIKGKLMAIKTKKTTQTENQPPAWAQELAVKYQAAIAHAFLIHGNVQDYVGGVAGQSLKSYLTGSFGERDLIVTWNRATGFHLPTAEMRQRFAEIVEFPIPGNPSPSVPGGRGLAASLNQMATSAPTDTAKLLEKVRQPGEALDYLNRLLRARPAQPMRAAVILDYAESIAPASDAAGAENDRSALVTLSEWGRDVAIGERGHILILIASDIHDLNERLRKSGARWEQVHIPFPTFEERRDFVRHLITSDGVKLADGLSYE